MSTGRWCKSSHSGEEQSCVEVAVGSEIGIRDTKDRSGGMLTVPSDSWAAFLAVARQ